MVVACPLHQFHEGKGTRRDFAIACHCISGCHCLPGLTRPPHSAVRTDFSIAAWDATVEVAKVCSPLWPACWIQCPDRSHRSSSEAVQNIWDVYKQELSHVPVRVRELFRTDDVDASWQIRSSEAEASLIRAYHSAGGPALAKHCSSVGRGRKQLCTKRLGSRFQDRIYRTDHADEFDVTHSGFFINSSLAPVLRFRRRLKSIYKVLEGTRANGFSDTRMTALWDRWSAVTRMGPTGPITSFEPWTDWILPDLHGFCKWVLDACSLLNDFVTQVARDRQASRFQAWSNWIRQDLSSHPHKYLVCKPEDTPGGSGVSVQPALMDAHFRKAWMPYFRREGHPVVTPPAFMDFVGNHLSHKAFLQMPAQVKNFTTQQWPRNPQLVVQMAGRGMRLSLFPHLGLLDWPQCCARLNPRVSGFKVSELHFFSL